MGVRILVKEEVEYECDFCDKITDYCPVEVIFSYGSDFDGDNKTFCSDECLKNYVNKYI